MATLQFTPRDWERVERDTMAWWNGELDRPLVLFSGIDEIPPGKRYGYMSNYPLDVPVGEIADLYEPVLAATRFYGDAFPWLWINFGPGIMAGFMGAEVNCVTEPSETTWFSLPGEVNLPDLHFAYDAGNVWWQRVQAVTAEVAARWDGQVAVGHTDLGGNLDILASFRTTDKLLYDLYDQPHEVERLVGEITALWLRYYDEQDALVRPICRGTSCWTPLWSLGKTYMLQCDFSYMISPAMFERFVMPDLVACCDHLDHGFYHLDGKGEIPHLDMLLSIDRLRGIQWIPGDGQPPPEQWLPLLKRIRDGGKLCQVFTSPDGAKTIVDNLGGKGFMFVIYHMGQLNEPEDAKAFLRTLASEM
jgi:5-methyltetrahydrofolate--homocysteine methyltransferase